MFKGSQIIFGKVTTVRPKATRFPTVVVGCEIKRSFSSSVDESVDIRDVSLGSNVSFVGLDWKSFYVRAMCALTGQ